MWNLYKDRRKANLILITILILNTFFNDFIKVNCSMRHQNLIEEQKC
jgi:hypothetical protein